MKQRCSAHMASCPKEVPQDFGQGEAMLWRSLRELWHKGRVRRVQRSVGITLWDYKYRSFPSSAPSFAQCLLSYTPRCVHIPNVPCVCAQPRRAEGCPTAGTCPPKHDLLVQLLRGSGVGGRGSALLFCRQKRAEVQNQSSFGVGVLCGLWDPGGMGLYSLPLCGSCYCGVFLPVFFFFLKEKSMRRALPKQRRGACSQQLGM